MASRLESRIKRLEALKGDDADAILASLDHEQGMALLTYLLALLEGGGEPSDERLRRGCLSRDRYAVALASIPQELQERFIVAFVAKVERAN